MPHKNIEDRRRYAKQWYAENVQVFLDKNARRKAQIKAFINKVKDVPCVDCGVCYPSYVMDLDHRDHTTKTITPGLMAGRGWRLERVKEELAKCDVVCANCHRERTYGKSLFG